MTLDDREFSLIRGSDVQRDGMYLELRESRCGAEHAVAEIFYSDTDGSFSREIFEPGVPEAVMAWFEGEAARLLPPQFTFGSTPGCLLNDTELVARLYSRQRGPHFPFGWN